MYEKIYSKTGELIGIKKTTGNSIEVFQENPENSTYKKYLIDSANGVEVIDNPPSNTDLLNIAKDKKILEIDSKTNQLISEGFTHNNKLFSMSQNAQINWLGLLNIKSTLTYPYKISKKEGGKYNIQDEAEMDLFLNTAISFKETIIDGGRTLQDQVLACTTIEELEAINDNRS